MTRAAVVKLSRLMPLLLLSAAGSAHADTGIPGPLILMAGSNTTHPLQWIASCMMMCIAVEGLLYSYWRLFRRPYLVSAWLNTISLVAGIPLSFIFMFDPTWFVLPTIASTAIEGWCALRLPRLLSESPVAREARRRMFLKVFAANVVSNVILAGYIYIAWRRGT